jgi:hypothetical protein
LKDLLWKELSSQPFLDVDALVAQSMSLNLAEIEDDFDFAPPKEEDEEKED